jgi:hypothetical protein
MSNLMQIATGSAPLRDGAGVALKCIPLGFIVFADLDEASQTAAEMAMEPIT